MLDIADWRNKIDEIDEKLLKLLNERAGYAIEIGKIKKKEGIKIYDPAREDEIFLNLCNSNKGPFKNESIRNIFRKIIEETKNIEIFSE